MIKGAPVTPEASTISGASATTEVQNDSAEVENNSASASDPVDAEAPAKILIPLEHCGEGGWDGRLGLVNNLDGWGKRRRTDGHRGRTDEPLA